MYVTLWYDTVRPCRAMKTILETLTALIIIRGHNALLLFVITAKNRWRHTQEYDANNSLYRKHFVP